MPLANILAPQLLRKAQEIEDAIGPPVPLNAGYLQVGYEKTPYDPKGLQDKPSVKSYDSRLSPTMATMGRMQGSPDPLMGAFAKGWAQGGESQMPGTHYFPNKATPIPTAPAGVDQPQAIGMTERGTPIYASKGGPQPPSAPGKKGRVIQLAKGAPVGVNERGESVTSQGRKLGYLTLQTPEASPIPPVETYTRGEMRTAERRPSDVGLSRHEGSNKFTYDTLLKKYGDDLKEYESNGGSFSKGWFKGMSATQRKDTLDAVKELQRRQKIAAEGIST